MLLNTPPELQQKLTFCTQTDTWTDRHTDEQTGCFLYTPQNIRFAGV